MAKKKIAFVIHSLQAGGMERVISILANDFALRNEVCVHLIMYGKNPEIFYKISNDIVIHSPGFEFDNSKRIESSCKRISYLRKEIKKLNPHSIISFGEIWNSLVLIATYGLNIPIYISDRNQPNRNLKWQNEWLRFILYRNARGIIAQTKVAKKIYSNKKLNSNIKVIGNPITFLSNSENIRRKNQILMVGRMIETKHYDRLISIFSKIENAKWNLVIVGDDALQEKISTKLQNLIQKLNIADRVILAGKQQNVLRYYLESKIFAFTSSSEGFPNVIGEAMSAGIPVVAYDCIAGPSDMISDNYDGFLIPLFDDDLFRTKLELLMKNKFLREQMGEKAKQSIKLYDSKVICQEYYDFIIQK